MHAYIQNGLNFVIIKFFCAVTELAQEIYSLMQLTSSTWKEDK